MTIWYQQCDLGFASPLSLFLLLSCLASLIQSLIRMLPGCSDYIKMVELPVEYSTAAISYAGVLGLTEQNWPITMCMACRRSRRYIAFYTTASEDLSGPPW